MEKLKELISSALGIDDFSIQPIISSVFTNSAVVEIKTNEENSKNYVLECWLDTGRIRVYEYTETIEPVKETDNTVNE